MTLTVYNANGLKKAASTGVYDSDFIGTVKAFAGKTIPTNWMLADGRPLLRLAYPELFTAIGTAYGVGDGSTTFNLPDLRSRFVYGASDPSGNGAVGGEATHLLTTAELPNHTHSITSTAFVSRAYSARTDLGESAAYISGSNGWTGLGTATPPSGWSVGGSGSGGAHNNLPPYVLIAQIIKVTGPQIDAGGALIGPAGNASVAMDTWHTVGAAGEPAFQNGWTAAPGYVVKFRKDPLGRVHLAGVAKPGTGPVIFTLPAGYLPPIIDKSFSCVTNTTPTPVGVLISGNVQATGYSAFTYIYIDDVDFDTELITAFPTGPQGPQGPAGSIGVVQEEGAALAGRSALNFIGPTVTAADDAANNRTNVTIAPNKTTVLVGTVGGTIGANQSVTPINAVSTTFIGQQWQADCESYGAFATVNMPIRFVLYLDGAVVLDTGYGIGGSPGTYGLYIAQSAVQAAISGVHTITFQILASNNPGSFGNYGQCRVTIRHNP